VTTPRIGAHFSVSGSLEQAARTAHKAGANTLQIFTASPRMWRGSRPDAGDVQRFAAARAELDLAPLAVHANYLINLASIDETIRGKSVQAFREELLRCLLLGVDFLVVHPGNYKDQSVETGIAAVALAVMEAAEGLPETRLTLLLENTAGQGASLGSRPRELAMIRALTEGKLPFRTGYCLDTCHCFAAGIDLIESAALLGFEHVHVIHSNDSKAPRGSRVDRHEKIGQGCIGETPFQQILTHPELRKKAFILEVPCEEDADYAVEIAVLKRLANFPRLPAG
jgi:deoxyribonuclease-4